MLRKATEDFWHLPTGLLQRALGERPECVACRVDWEWPRHIDYRCLPNPPVNLDPRGFEEAVVAHQNVDLATREPLIHEDLFTKIRFTRTQRHRLVTEFHYDKNTGDAFYDIKGQALGSRNLSYGQLLTLNSWHMTLLNAMLYVCSNMMDLQSNIMLCAVLYTDETLSEMFRTSKHVFTAVFAFILTLSILLAWREALTQFHIKSNPHVGNLVKNCHWWDSLWHIAALGCFVFFDVEAQVSDVVMRLHPWNAVQPFAAFKCENVRAFVLGFSNRRMFDVENHPGQHTVMPLQLLTRTLVTIYKIYLWWQHPKQNLTLLLAFLSSVPSVVWGLVRLWYLCRDRRQLHRALVAALQSCSTKEAERNVAKNLLAHHFRQRYNDPRRGGDGKLQRVRIRDLRRDEMAESGRCVHCGRRKGSKAGENHPLPPVAEEMQPETLEVVESKLDSTLSPWQIEPPIGAMQSRTLGRPELSLGLEADAELVDDRSEVTMHAHDTWALRGLSPCRANTLPPGPWASEWPTRRPIEIARTWAGSASENLCEHTLGGHSGFSSNEAFAAEWQRLAQAADREAVCFGSAQLGSRSAVLPGKVPSPLAAAAALRGLCGWRGQNCSRLDAEPNNDKLLVTAPGEDKCIRHSLPSLRQDGF